VATIFRYCTCLRRPAKKSLNWHSCNCESETPTPSLGPRQRLHSLPAFYFTTSSHSHLLLIVTHYCISYTPTFAWSNLTSSVPRQHDRPSQSIRFQHSAAGRPQFASNSLRGRKFTIQLGRVLITTGFHRSRCAPFCPPFAITEISRRCLQQGPCSH